MTGEVFSEKPCVCCGQDFSVQGSIADTPDLCRACWNFARVNFARFRLLIGDWQHSEYPVRGGCVAGTCRDCDGE